jgi:NAD(P)-dependent dehydrogenase (short-subunit alcohol dehydrogenase family)
MIDLSGQHVFVVGGSRGIGAAAARMAAAAGAAVSLSYVSRREAAWSVRDTIVGGGGRCHVVRADAAADLELDLAVDEAVAEMGPLTGMVVSAGIFEGLPIEQMTAEFWDRVMGVNLRGTFLAVRAAARHMRQTGGGGSIVIYTSTAGQRGSGVFSAYAASKAGQTIFMRSMATELASDRIRVNCVAPAWTETDMAAEKMDEIGRDTVIAGFPLGRIGLPDDVAGATCFLLSDLAGFITGSTITVDGGQDMRG